jgi:hypothetical protein
MMRLCTTSRPAAREKKSRLLDRRELPRRIEQRVDAGLAAVRLRREPPAHQTVVKTTSNCTSDALERAEVEPDAKLTIARRLDEREPAAEPTAQVMATVGARVPHLRAAHPVAFCRLSKRDASPLGRHLSSGDCCRRAPDDVGEFAESVHAAIAQVGL